MGFFARARSDSERGNGLHLAAVQDEASAGPGRRLADAGEQAAKRLSEGRDLLETLVRKQPAVALGAALAAGVIIGWLIKRR
jgi:ElaB/YqjD/DUF883 family membrane-anchored ribosome-binding protein